MLPRPGSTLLVSLCAALLPSAAWADGTTVSGTGEATVHVVPTKLRVQVQIQAQGKTAELALQRLKARREAVAETLRGLGAEKESVAFGDPSVNKLATPVPPCCPCAPCYPAASPYPPAPGYSSPPTYRPPLSPYGGPPPTVGPPSATPVPPLPPSGARGSLPPPTVTLPSVPLVPPELPSSGARGDSSLPGPSAPSPSSPSSPSSPPSTYPPAATSGTATVPSAVSVPNASLPNSSTPTYTPPAAYQPAAASVPNFSPANSSAPSFTPAYGYGTASTPGYAPAPPPAPAEVYMATGTLTIEWSLGANTAEQAFLAGEAIRKKVLAADLVGDKATEKASAGEQEEPDETHFGAPPQIQTAVARNPYSAVSWDPFFGRTIVTSPCPTLVYVAPISSQQRKAALAEAFGKAKSQAAEVAEAAGGKLGAATAVSGTIANSGCSPWSPFLVATPATFVGISPDGNEALAADPSAMRFCARINATFRLE